MMAQDMLTLREELATERYSLLAPQRLQCSEEKACEVTEFVNRFFVVTNSQLDKVDQDQMFEAYLLYCEHTLIVENLPLNWFVHSVTVYLGVRKLTKTVNRIKSVYFTNLLPHH